METFSPSEARLLFRSGHTRPTAGFCSGYTQANLLAVPAEWAYDVLLFAHRNPRPCPVLDITDPGSPRTVLAPDADLRTDLPAYQVWLDGELVDEVPSVLELWHSDLVAFVIGCSFTFETALASAGVPIRHIEQAHNVPMYLTSRPCRPAGRMRGPMVVSMRPIPAPLVPLASAITEAMPDVHGAPVHAGDPADLGIRSLSSPDFGAASDFEPDDVPVFWACGVTLQAAVMASRPPYALTHKPGHMLITDEPARDVMSPSPGSRSGARSPA